jgi:hypothetical protein
MKIPKNIFAAEFQLSFTLVSHIVHKGAMSSAVWLVGKNTQINT